MHALLGKLSAGRDRRVGAPFILIAGPSANSVAATRGDRPPEIAAFKTLMRFPNRRVVPMIEAAFEDTARGVRGRHHGLRFRQGPAQRLFA